MLFRDDAVFPILDQAFVSAGLFFPSVALAHFGGPEEFGSFAVAVSAVVLVGVVQGALITRPLSVVGNLVQGEDRKEYLSSLSFVQLILGLATTVIVSASFAAWQLTTSGLNLYWILALAAFVGAHQAREYERFLCLSRLRPKAAVVRGLSYSVSAAALIAIIVLVDKAWLTSETTLLALAVAAAIGFAPHLLATSRGEQPPARASLVAARRNLEYSKWELFGSLSNYAYIGLIPVLFGLQGSMAAAGGYAACRTLLGPAQVAIFGAYNALVPAATALRRIDSRRSTRYAVTVLLRLLAISSPFLALGVVVPGRVLAFVYGPGFSPFAGTLQIFAAYCLVNCFAVTVHGLLLSRQDPRGKGVSQFVGMLAGLAFIFFNFATLTASRAALGTLIAEAVALAGATVFMLSTPEESPSVRRSSTGRAGD